MIICNSGNNRCNIKPIYSIDLDGNIKNINRNKSLKTFIDKDGYVCVGLICTDNISHTFFIHRLIMANFSPVENMEALQVNHKDGVKTNNSIENLEWCTAVENIRHAHNLGLHYAVGEFHPRHKITNEQASTIRELLQHGNKACDISRDLNVPIACVYNIANKNYYKNAVL